MSINRVSISGNLTRDPELRSTAGGTQVLTFGVAVNDRVRDQQTGQWGDRPNFVDCIVFGNRAPALADILHKGAKVAVDGKLRYSAWEANDGSKRSRLEVVADEVDLMQVGRQQQPQPQSQPQPQHQPRYQPQPYASPAPRTAAPAQAQMPHDEDIPF